ncbi:toll/interleukin-1 receptor domain-containing protein [Kutzneria albida]|uniref:TIR domain-containing protein n=1 Tax=Kutzneria albida DSM 43870 TaxID=1449976 RepID=W5W997_9PSEU|nr:toll/interleukin-1 receptor domain-containing protein [Kutzneria albida]AHH97325.1 hypothetical protein KALB_3961 [Kutzneria albida DSM 43870]
MAERLGRELGERGVTPFVDARDILPGQDLVLTINDALTQSDYFVLLWSRNTVGRRWVDLEWTAALARDLEDRRCFLFVVRLDDTPLPLILTMRRYLDAFGSWETVADELAGAWRRDQAVGLPVLPAPVGVDLGEGPTSVLYVRNRALSVAHTVAVPSSATGRELEKAVRTSLALPDQVTELGGKVGLTFHYQLRHRGQEIADQPLPALHITEGSMIDLEVELETWDSDGTVCRTTYRTNGYSGLPPEMIHKLVNSGIGHLRPRRG